MLRMSFGTIRRSRHVDDLEPSQDWFKLWRLWPDVFGAIVAGDDKVSRTNRREASILVLGQEWLLLGPSLEIAQHESVCLLDVIDQNSRLSLVEVPVFGLVFGVQASLVGKVVYEVASLATPCIAMDPQVELMEFTFQWSSVLGCCLLLEYLSCLGNHWDLCDTHVTFSH